MLRWWLGDAVEPEDGTAFAIAEHAARVLEGASSEAKHVLGLVSGLEIANCRESRLHSLIVWHLELCSEFVFIFRFHEGKFGANLEVAFEQCSSLLKLWGLF